ncbi:MAG: hypothetical protein WC511_06280 [Candidatus Pacearchaeota archaeon]|jgi:hypothetical protein
MFEKTDSELKDFNLFLATGSKQYLEFLLICNVKNILISYAYSEPWQMKGLIKRNNINLICDSGAFTAWNLSQKARLEECIEMVGDPGFWQVLNAEGKAEIERKVDEAGKWKRHLVDIDKYLEHLEKHKDIIWRAVNLDVIPGKQGAMPTEQERLDAAEQGWKNYQYLKSKGWDTIHVYHQFEPIWVLDRMLDECDYIGVSPCNDSSEKSKLEWMDEIFRHIMNYDYSKNPRIKPGEIIKTHGFAVTSKTLVERFPWYTVDSSSYSLTAAMGNILTSLGRIYVSDQNLNDPDHANNRPQLIKEHIDNHLKELIGYGIQSMMEKEDISEAKCPKCHTKVMTTQKTQAYKPRNFANICFYLDLQERRRKNGPTLDFMRQATLL